MQGKILVLLFCGVLMGALDIAIIGPVLPELKTVFGIPEEYLPWVFTAYVLANLISTPLMASLSDHFGRKYIYILNLILFGLGSCLIALSGSFETLLTGRVLQGIGSGGIFPLASAIIGDVFPREKQGRALGITGAVFGLAFLAGPPLGSWLLMWDWRLIFLINIPIVLLMLPFAWKWLPGKPEEISRAFDLWGMVLLSVSLLLIAYGLSHLLENIGQAFAIFPGGFLLFLWFNRNQKLANPVIDPSLLKNKLVRKVMLLAWGAGIGEVAVIFLPALAGQRFQVNTSEGGFMLIPLILALAIGAPVAGRLLDKIGPKSILLSGLILITTGLAGTALIDHDSLPAYYTTTILIGLGLSALLGAPLRYILNGITTKNNRAEGQALISLSTGTGQLMASAIAGPLFKSSGNYGLLLLLLSLITLLLIIPVWNMRSVKDQVVN